MSKLAVMPLEDYQNACREVRSCLGDDGLIKSGELSQKINIVYNSGIAFGSDMGFEAGKQTYEKDFWDVFQAKGERRWYWGAFTGEGWTDKTFNPKYPIIADSTAHNYMFRNCRITTIPKITILATAIHQVFYDAKQLITTCLALPNGGNSFNQTFQNCIALENLTIEGEIRGNGLDVSTATKLNKASWISIINALSSDTSGLSITGSLASVQKAFETVEGANDGDISPEWLNLKATKSNWGVSLK